MGVADAKRAIIDWLAGRGDGESDASYKLRDWLFSRQRYWGEPFPIVWDERRRRSRCRRTSCRSCCRTIDDYAPRAYDPDDADTEPEPPLGARDRLGDRRAGPG